MIHRRTDRSARGRSRARYSVGAIFPTQRQAVESKPIEITGGRQLPTLVPFLLSRIE
jgi:hypothetical protein